MTSPRSSLSPQSGGTLQRAPTSRQPAPAGLRRALHRHSLPFLAKWAVQRAFRRITAQGRTLPDFVIIGAQRCGTTSLYNYLADHPGVASAFLKETHFFDLHFSKGLGWYRAHFPLASQLRTRCQIVGEATPYYLFYPHAARRLHAAIPDAKRIVLLRNPIDRAYSHYHHEVSMGVETLSFEDALAREQETLPAETARVVADEGYQSFAHFHYSYLARGIYIDQLEPWLRSSPVGRVSIPGNGPQTMDHRPRSPVRARCNVPQPHPAPASSSMVHGPSSTDEVSIPGSLLVLRSEDFYADPAAVVQQVFLFLGLPVWESGTYKKYNLAHYADMNPATRERLASFYRPHNQRLYEALGIDFGWGI